jgi:hypothetical protein
MGSGFAPVRPPPGLPAGERRAPCYVRAAVLGRGGIIGGGLAATLVVIAAALVGGCGGGGERQDAGDSSATYRVRVSDPSFPARQGLAEEAELRMTVRNLDDRTIPNLAATIGMAGDGTQAAAFGSLSKDSGLSSRSRPVWVVDDGPLSGDTAYANTWALGPLAPGDERTFVWRVTAVEPGRYVVTYRLAGSLTGGARLETPDGRVPRGRFAATISGRPRGLRVTDDGRIVSVPG